MDKKEQTQNVMSSENKVLGMIFCKPSLMYDLQRQLSEEMFSAEANKIIYERMSSLFDETYLPDISMITESLKSAGLLESVGGEAYLRYLKEGIHETDFSNIKEYLNIISKAFKSRQILKISKYVRRLEDNIDVVDDVLEDIKSKIDYIDTKGFKSNAEKISAFLTQSWKNYVEKVNNPGLIGTTTGYQSLDGITGGYRGGNLWVLGGRPSHGKTAFMLNSVLKVARKGKKSLVFSLEMNEQQIIERLASLISGVEHTKIMLGTTSKAESELVKEAYRELKNLPIFLSTIYDLDAGEITKTIKEKTLKEGIEVVWIDYVQLTTERDTEAVHTIGRISRACKLLSKELDIFIGLVSQLNRSVEMRENKRPRKSDLRQSGNLEEDADLVAFIYRDEVYNKDDESNKGVMEFIIDKHRNGPIGMIPMKFRKETMGINDG